MQYAICYMPYVSQMQCDNNTQDIKNIWVQHLKHSMLGPLERDDTKPIDDTKPPPRRPATATQRLR